MTKYPFMDDELEKAVIQERKRVVRWTAELARQGDERAIWVRNEVMKNRPGFDIVERFL